MHAHGIEVFNGTDDDAVVVLVAHHFHFNFFPAEYGLFHQYFTGEAGIQTSGCDFFEIFLIVSHTAAGTAEREGRADDQREGHGRRNAAHVVHIAGYFTAGNFQSDPFHGFTEQFAAFGLFDDIGTGADEFHAAFGEDSGFCQFQSRIQAGLSAQCGQNGIRAFLADDGGHGFRLNGFNVGTIRHVGIGHDGGGVGIDKDDFVAFFLECLDRLGA